MEIRHCCRCDRDWCFHGTGRPVCCGRCKSPYWDRERKLVKTPGEKFAAPGKNMEPETKSPPVSPETMEKLRQIAAGRGLGIEVELRKPPVSVGTSSMGSWSMDTLPQTASGEVAPGPGVRGIEIVEEMNIAEARRRWPDALEGGIDPVVKLCPYKELDPERGEWVFCALPVHGSKVRHVPGKREGA